MIFLDYSQRFTAIGTARQPLTKLPQPHSLSVQSA
jgi:hypothetical protein